MAHVGWPVGFEKLQRLRVGEMPFPAADAVLQEVRITALLQHGFIVIGFEKSGMALLKVMDQLITGDADIREHTDPRICIVTGDDEAVRIGGIVMFGKCGNVQAAYGDGLKRLERQCLLQLHAAVAEGAIRNIYRQTVFFGQHRDTADVINMLM